MTGLGHKGTFIPVIGYGTIRNGVVRKETTRVQYGVVPYLVQVRVERSRVQRSLNVEDEEVQPPNTYIDMLAG
jgi:hypothetical protein